MAQIPLLQRDEYLLLFVGSTRQMQKCINNNVSGYKGVEEWTKLYFKGCSNSMKITMVLFEGHGHWNVFILDDIMTLHLDSMHGIRR
jgi:hypothetical protein